MLFNKLVITNLSDADITVCTVTYPVGQSILLFDSNDSKTYGATLTTMLKGFGDMRRLATTGKIRFNMNDMVDITTDAQFDVLQAQVTQMTIQHQAGFLDNSRFYFNMRTKEWCVRDPLTGDTYSIIMVKS